jgi:hypothetical protein
LVHLTPATAVLSLTATVRLASKSLVGAVLLIKHRVAQPPLLLSAGTSMSDRRYLAGSGIGSPSSSARTSCAVSSNPPRRTCQSSMTLSGNDRPAALASARTSAASSFVPLFSRQLLRNFVVVLLQAARLTFPMMLWPCLHLSKGLLIPGCYQSPSREMDEEAISSVFIIAALSASLCRVCA